MPTNAELVRMVRQHILDPDSSLDPNVTTPRYSDSFILLQMNNSAKEVAKLSLCTKATDTINTVAGTQEYALPADFLQMRYIMYLSDTGVSPQQIDEVPLVNTLRTNSDFEGPSGWARRTDSVIRLDAAPPNSVVGGLVLDYYAFPADLASVGSSGLGVPTRYHDTVVYGTAGNMLLIDEEPQKAADMNARFKSAITEALDKEAAASANDPGYVRDSYSPLTGGFNRFRSRRFF